MTDHEAGSTGNQGPALPPSRFGAGYTVGPPESPAPTYAASTGYGSPDPGYFPLPTEPPGRVSYPEPVPQPGVYPAQPLAFAYPVVVRRTNAMAIAALASSLVLAPLGIIFGHIALSQIKSTGEDGKGLAIAGLVIGYIFTAIVVLWFVVFGMFLSALSSAVDESNNYTTMPVWTLTLPADQLARL
ncbi:DUF4190 domain-containing protein [Mycobacterium sp. NBC_00419]|uniref:DUF4190 domain-containing protein n=1 Tax=Mycobacterium sp. NBC_00419 TaxID=2975989 RepID=UPI002E1D1B5F